MSDRELAQHIGVSPETINNWRTGAVGELKTQKLEAVKRALTARVAALRERAGLGDADLAGGSTHLEIAADASPAELQRKLRDRMHYDYLGHRFLYFEPQGALAWESLIRDGYEQDCWLTAVRDCAARWMEPGRHRDGTAKGPIASALGLSRKQRLRGLDIVSLGPGEGGKEILILQAVDQMMKLADASLPWRSITLIDVSIPLLLKAAVSARRHVGASAFEHQTVLALCGDFEEGGMDFVSRLPTTRHESDAGRRLVLILGNVFGNLRHEDGFVRQKLARLVRPGDLLWVEVAVRTAEVERDPLYRLVGSAGSESSAETNRRLLLEGPYRRWEAALGRTPAKAEFRVWVRQDDDSCRIPGSYNFCHDLVLTEERRALTMLYSRRYDVDALTSWFAHRGYETLRVVSAGGSKREQQVAHMLLRRVADRT